MKHDIDFANCCHGCKWGCFTKHGFWQYCDIYYYTDGRKRPEPDGTGGCRNYTAGPRPKTDVFGGERS